MSNGGKNKREEELLTDRQKRTILEMWERDSDEGGVAVGFIMERFSLWDLTPSAIIEIVTAERAKRRAKERAGTDWAKRFAGWS